MGIIRELIMEIIMGTIQKLTMRIKGTLREHTETAVTHAWAVVRLMLVVL